MAGITLAQLAQVEVDPAKKWIMLNILRECKVMSRLPFENVSSLQVRAAFWETLPTGGTWRSVNEGYTSAEDGQIGDAWEALYGFGGDITFDTVMEKVGNVIKDPVQLQMEGKLKSMSMDWNYAFINGDQAVDPKQFNGLKKRVASLPSRQTVYAAGSTAAPVDPTASAALARGFINNINMAWRYCNAGNVNMILCNEDFIVGFSRVLALMQSGGNYLSVTKDEYGREEVSYRGVPFVDMGLKKDMSTEVISNAETAGDGGADSMSVYFVSVNTQDGLYGIQLNSFNAYDPLNGGEMESKPSKMRRVDWWNGLATFGRYGIVRLRNIERLADWTE